MPTESGSSFGGQDPNTYTPNPFPSRPHVFRVVLQFKLKHYRLSPAGSSRSQSLSLRDGNRTHTAVLWGGTGFNWRSGSPRYITPTRPAKFWYDHYANSARKLRDLAAKAGADVLLSNHPQYDKSTTKLSTMAKRGAGQPHP